jgi:D-glycero-D-manno-heptose 1,7-bisphosphate phosphatase
MREALLAQGARIDAVYYCPHHPEGTVKELAIRCDCRKPAPGMLEQAARDWPIDRARSILIGDKDNDVAAAKAFGIRGIKFDAKAGTLEDVVRKILAGEA